jgi:hypothetical protein
MYEKDKKKKEWQLPPNLYFFKINVCHTDRLNNMSGMDWITLGSPVWMTYRTDLSSSH